MIEALIRHEVGAFTLDVDFRSKGPVLGIFGHSGSGKTTLLNTIAGMLRPRLAQLSVQGKLLSDRPASHWVRPEQRQIGLVPQDALLFPHLTTRENLNYSPHSDKGLDSDYSKQILEVLHLAPLLDRESGQLSGGERQRVALGRALLAKPRLLLLDEPAASLDAELARAVLALLLETKRVFEVPMIFVTHRPPELLALADDCLVLEAGRVVAQGPPVDVLARPRAMGIAKLAGVDNLLRVPVLDHQEEGGLTLVDLGGLELATPFCANGVGSMIDIGLYAEDLILCLERPKAISARNALACRVTALESVDREILVRLQVGKHELLARVTPSARDALHLVPGLELVCLIKTTACHHLSS